MYSKPTKSRWLLFLFVIIGIIIGGFVSKYLSPLPYLGWLDYGKPFGLVQPLSVNLVDALTFQLGFLFQLNIASIIGIIIAILIYRKI